MGPGKPTAASSGKKVETEAAMAVTEEGKANVVREPTKGEAAKEEGVGDGIGGGSMDGIRAA